MGSQSAEGALNDPNCSPKGLQAHVQVYFSIIVIRSPISWIFEESRITFVVVNLARFVQTCVKGVEFVEFVECYECYECYECIKCVDFATKKHPVWL